MDLVKFVKVHIKQETISVFTMPAKEDPAKVAANEFDNEFEDWNREFKMFVKQTQGAKATSRLVDMVEKRYEKVVKAFRELKKADPNYKTSCPTAEKSMDRVREEYSQSLQTSTSGASDDEKESKDSLSIKILTAEVEAYDDLINEAEVRLQKQYNDFPEPTNVSVSIVNKAAEDIKAAEKEASSVHVKLTVLLGTVTGFEDQKTESNVKWSKVTSSVAEKLARVEEYVAKYRAAVQERAAATVRQAQMPNVQQGASVSDTQVVQPKNLTLERLPLPTFDGSKKNYLRFKKEFSNHVTYNTDKERMLALKSKCLVKYKDRSRVENEQTLKECWDRLDEEYGDINTLVAEVFLEWQSLKPPKSDQEFIKFVTCIENGVSCLKSLGHDKEVEFSFMSVTLEKKLDDRMKKEFSLEYTSDQDQNKERMKSLLHYLKKQKAAAHLRFCNYMGSKAKDEETSVDIKSSSTLQYDGGRARGGRGRSRGGRGRGYRQEGSQQSDAELQEGSFRGRGGYKGRGRGGAKRGESSKSCLVCDQDHQTSKCGKWRNKSASKW